LPADYHLKVGRGACLRPGADAAIIGYGTVLLANAYRAAEQLASEGINAAVIDLPWLNRIDDEWVREELSKYPAIVTLDNHYAEFGQGVMIAAALARTKTATDVSAIALTEIPACGSNADVLKHHRLDPESIAHVVRERAGRTTSAIR
jgi:transketolase